MPEILVSALNLLHLLQKLLVFLKNAVLKSARFMHYMLLLYDHLWLAIDSMISTMQVLI